MKKLGFFLGITGVLCLGMLSADDATFTSKQYGFSIDIPLTAPPGKDESTNLAEFMVSQKGAKIAIRVYNTDLSMEDWNKVIMEEYSKLNITPETQVSENEALYHYTVKRQTTLHVFQRAVKHGSKIFLLIGGGVDDWDTVQDPIIKSIKGFKFVEPNMNSDEGSNPKIKDIDSDIHEKRAKIGYKYILKQS